MTVFYVTKYALSDGIQKVEGEVLVDRLTNKETGAIQYKIDGYNSYQYGEGRHWHRDPGTALARAETMRVAKLKSLERLSANMRAMTFSVPT